MKNQERPEKIPSITTPPRPFRPPRSDQEVAVELIEKGLQVAEEDLRETHQELANAQPIDPRPYTTSPPTKNTGVRLALQNSQNKTES